MKKLLAVLLSVFMMVGLVACSNNNEPTPTESAQPTEQTTVEGTTKVGLGSVTSLKLTDATEDAEASVQFATTYALVVLDAEGKIVQAQFDVAQNTVAFDGAEANAVPTKLEKQYDYNMAGASSLEKGEWFEQIAAFEAWVAGKTVEEVKNAETAVQGNGHEGGESPVDLATSCTMATGDFVAALEKAAASAVDANGATTFGFASVTGLKSEAATEDKDAKAQADTTISVVGLDGETIKVVITDVAQNSATVNAEGVVTGEAVPTKVEKQYDYNMAGSSSLEKGEWFEQAAAYNAWCVGKTAAEVEGAEVAVQGNAHEGSESPVDLATSCTMATGDMTAAVVKAASVAK